MNNSILPALSYLTDSRLGTIQIADNEIKSIIMSLNPNKTHGCDNISIKMLQLCAEPIHIPLGIIFRNIVKTVVYFQTNGNLQTCLLFIKKMINN